MEQDTGHAPIHLTLRPSRTLGLILLSIHAAAMTVLLPLMAPLWGKLLLAAAILISLTQNLRRHVLLVRPQSIIQLVWQRTGEWSLMRRDGVVQEAQLLPSTFVHHRLMVLNFRLRQPWRRPSVVLFDDAASATTLRHLRVRLRTEQ